MDIFLVMDLLDSDGKLSCKSSGNLELEQTMIRCLFGISKATSCRFCYEAEVRPVGSTNAETIKNSRKQWLAAAFSVKSLTGDARQDVVLMVV